MRSMRNAICLMAFGLSAWGGGAVAQERPAKMASEARLDLTPDRATGRLTDGAASIGDIRVERMNWLPADEQDRGYVVHIAATHRGWREFELRFTPAATGTVTLSIKGPWEDSGQFRPYRQEIEWDNLSAEGTTLPAGGFEGADPLTGWGGGAEVIAGTEERPARDGRSYVRVWHDAPLLVDVPVVANQAVTLRGFIRAARPVGFTEMRRLPDNTAAHTAAARYRKGVNFGNHFEVPRGQDWGARYSLEDVSRVRSEGFDHIRLPVGWHSYAGPGPQFAIEPEFFQAVDAYVDAAVREGLGIIINIHHFDDFTSDPSAQRAKFAALWRQIAEHYQGHSELVAFELLNEPKDAATTDVMNGVYAEVLPLIRRTNPNRTVFVGPGLWNRVAELESLRLPDDDERLIVTVHCYDPFEFTHQGASWAGPDQQLYRGVRFPAPPAEPFVPRIRRAVPPSVQDWINAYNTQTGAANPCSPEGLQRVIDAAREWSAYYGRPLHMGEFGAFEAADAESRANYYREFRTRLESADMGWAIWDWRAGFRYWNPETNQPEPGLRDALLAPVE
ncbi:MAG: glycoside hydrolase family 5 protein [Planctomyces sp.]|nr:glycoside hydrolase family 5 protein [Planctomyces sp.]